jgi:hypothetical protein
MQKLNFTGRSAPIRTILRKSLNILLIVSGTKDDDKFPINLEQ